MILNKAKYIILIILSCILFSGCVYDAPPQSDGGGKGSVYLKLNITTLDTKEGSRATDDNNYFQQPAFIFETVKTMRVIIIRPNGEMEYNRMLELGSDGKPINDSERFQVLGGEKKRIYLIVNEASIDYNFDIDNLKPGNVFPEKDIAGIQIARNAGAPLYDNRGDGKTGTYIPMSEVFEVQVQPADPESTEDVYQTADLFVTRAAVKFSFNIKTSSSYTGSGLYVTGLRVNGISDREFFIPCNTVYNPAKYEPSNEPLGGRFITSYTVPANAESGSYLFPISEAADIDWSVGQGMNIHYEPPIYLPESDPKNSYSVGVLLSDSESPNNIWLEAKLLDNLSSLPRNTHVIVNITINSDSDLQWEVKVVPYAEVKLDPIFGLD